LVWEVCLRMVASPLAKSVPQMRRHYKHMIDNVIKYILNSLTYF
jgi:hypothetical protein